MFVAENKNKMPLGINQDAVGNLQSIIAPWRGFLEAWKGKNQEWLVRGLAGLILEEGSGEVSDSMAVAIKSGQRYSGSERFRGYGGLWQIDHDIALDKGRGKVEKVEWKHVQSISAEMALAKATMVRKGNWKEPTIAITTLIPILSDVAVEKMEGEVFSAYYLAVLNYLNRIMDAEGTAMDWQKWKIPVAWCWTDRSSSDEYGPGRTYPNHEIQMIPRMQMTLALDEYARHDDVAKVKAKLPLGRSREFVNGLRSTVRDWGDKYTTKSIHPEGTIGMVGVEPYRYAREEYADTANTEESWLSMTLDEVVNMEAKKQRQCPLAIDFLGIYQQGEELAARFENAIRSLSSDPGKERAPFFGEMRLLGRAIIMRSGAELLQVGMPWGAQDVLRGLWLNAWYER